jgi:hypothetical protein|tara:strand:+ start:290 stop:481 length:192 start_codon:yes stop_codon:yes gene_type:complete
MQRDINLVYAHKTIYSPWVPIEPRKKGYAPNYLNINKNVSPEKFKKFYDEEIEYFQKYQNKIK